MTAKERVAGAAISYVRSGMVVGLGTGSTADCFLKALSAAIKTGALKDIRGIATSLQSERRARELGIPLAALGACPGPDITVDGCDEVDARLDLIKGLGGALLREKVVAQNSRKLIIIADSSKRVDVLGSRTRRMFHFFGRLGRRRFFATRPKARCTSRTMAITSTTAGLARFQIRRRLRMLCFTAQGWWIAGCFWEWRSWR